jgi:CheY-like chemotaxis protein
LDQLRLAAVFSKPVRAAQLCETLIVIFEGEKAPASLQPVVPIFDETLGQRQPLRILLAEDNGVNQKVALRMLSRLGYRADVAANGYEVLEALERQPYDLILMDIQMPEMDGIEATRQIHGRHSAAERPRIIAMTAHALQDIRQLCLDLGMAGYITKPIRIEELVNALRYDAFWPPDQG